MNTRPVVLLVAVAAAAVLLSGNPVHGKPAAAPWPNAKHADIPGQLADGTTFTPGLFLDANTAVGTALTADGHWQRLVIRAPNGTIRELSRLPAEGDPNYDDFATAGNDIVWTESSDTVPLQIWAADPHGGAPRLLAPGGDAIFYGDQDDFVYANGRIHWAATTNTPGVTHIDSVALTGGGAVVTRTVNGSWGLSVWPWLSNSSRLHNMSTGQDENIRVTPPDTATCTPEWCLVMVMTKAGALTGIDLMHPDGSGRTRIAGGNEQAALEDAVMLDRFEVLSEPDPNSNLTGTAGLLVYDLATGRTVTICPAAGTVSERDGILWWSTGDHEATIWHILDLRSY